MLRDHPLHAFGDTPVLWALRKPPPGLKERAPTNIRIVKWTPQKDVLKHPAVKAFLSHGGMNAVRESLASGTPLLIMPFFGDQPDVAQRVVGLGAGVVVDKTKMSADALR